MKDEIMIWDQLSYCGKKNNLTEWLAVLARREDFWFTRDVIADQFFDVGTTDPLLERGLLCMEVRYHLDN